MRNYVVVMLLIVLVLMLCGILFFFFKLKKLSHKETNVIVPPPVQITMETDIGKNWTDYGFNGIDKFQDMFFLRIVSDGKVIREPIPIKTKEGERLVTALATFRGYYYDAEQKKVSVLIPVLMKLKDGRMFHIAYKNAITWNEKEIENQISGNPDFFGAKKGQEITVGLLLPTISVASGGDGQTIRSAVNQLVIKYNQSFKNEMDKFINSGNPDIGIIIPISFADSSKNHEVAF